MNISFMSNIYLFLSRKFHLSTGNYRSSKILQLISDMPKDRTHLPALKTQRQAVKVIQTRYPPAVITLQVLGNGARGAPRALYVSTDQSRYLFNCGECSQRLAHEHKLKLGKLEHIFFTHSSWSNFGGLPGVSLTIQDVGVPSIKLHGPPGLDGLFKAASRFIILKNLEVSCIDATISNASFEDAVMKIEYVPILPSTLESKVVDEKIAPPFLSEDKMNHSSNGETEPSAKKQKTSDENLTTPSLAWRAAVNYICRLQPKKGVLSFEKCVELGVPVGPLLGRLKAGENVTLKDGRIIRSEDVCSPDDPGPVFLVVECPTKDYLDNLLKNEKLKAFFASNVKEESDIPEVIVHFTPRKLTRLPEYIEWMDGFPASTYHMHLGTPDDDEVSRRDLGSVSVHRIQHKLNLLHPDIFPLLPVDFPVEGERGSSLLDTETLLQYHLRPKKKLDDSMVLSLTPSAYTSECYDVDGFTDSLNDFKKKLTQEPINGHEYPRVVFFGTGSQIPSKTRNTSGILVELEPQRYILLDCGEGTYTQLVRFYGLERSFDVLSNLIGIYISHLHADHHIGLIGMLQARQHALKQKNLPEEPLFLIAPAQINYWLQWYDGMMEPLQSQFRLVSCQSLLSESVESSLITRLNLKQLKTCRVRHCPNAFGVTMTTKEGYKLTYSGDTMPCDDLIGIGKNSDLLIHEATMEDGMEIDAAAKTHSTTSQAIDVGVRMEAKFILLTHFSQRYAKIPIFGPQMHQNVGVAFDNMCVSPSQLHLLPSMIPILKLMFAEQYQEMEERGQKRQMREEKLKQLQEA